MIKIEKRTFKSEIRASKTGKLVGYAAVFNSDSEDMGFVERIAPGAFKNALKMSDARALWNHNPDYVLGRESAGTLHLKEDSKGLLMEVDPPDTQWAQDLRKSIQRGDVSEMSFGFSVKREQWDAGGTVRTLLEIDRLFDVSPVTFPAYQSTVIEARNLKKENKMYTKKNFAKILSDMEAAEGAELTRLAAEYDRVATVVDDSAPLVRDCGVPGVLRWSRLSDGLVDRTQVNSVIEVGENRAGLKPWETRGHFLQAVVSAGSPGGQTDPRLFRAATGLSESVPSDGGFLLDTEMATEILQPVWDNSLIPSKVSKMSIKNPSIKINGIDETSRADGSRSGGIQGFWAAEAAEKTKSKPKFRQIELNPRKLVGLCYLTDELLEDVSALEGFVANAYQKEFDFKITDAIINGTGAGQPLGIRNAGCMVSVGKEAGQAADTIVFSNVCKMFSRHIVDDPSKTCWVINKNCLETLYSMSIAIGTAGHAVYLPSNAPNQGATGGGLPPLFGLPVYPLEQCATVGDTGDIMLCDFSGYRMVDRGKTKNDISMHVRFIYDESVLRCVYRVDGQPTLASPITPKNSTDTVSHFVKIDARA